MPWTCSIYFCSVFCSLDTSYPFCTCTLSSIWSLLSHLLPLIIWMLSPIWTPGSNFCKLWIPKSRTLGLLRGIISISLPSPTWTPKSKFQQAWNSEIWLDFIPPNHPTWPLAIVEAFFFGPVQIHYRFCTSRIDKDIDGMGLHSIQGLNMGMVAQLSWTSLSIYWMCPIPNRCHHCIWVYLFFAGS